METDTAERAATWLSEDEQRAWRVHLDVSRLLMYQLERDLQPFGLTNNDYEILVNLSEADERRMRMSDLARSTLQSKSRLSHQITRMEAAGLVRRENCEEDRRGLYAVLTEQGWETMREVAPRHVASVRAHFIGLISPEDLASYHQAMLPVAQHLREERSRV
ncbi:MarR family winged helix-turn-helix transcriptional regulator [Streptomyces sp. NPDC020917]|uniref:MarR family winged helix-turn-helix transcriptional regulator n=1 Tax=Streptomyces sp. NPDC020917 TaxID=3365102 RepID=UPI0037990A78